MLKLRSALIFFSALFCLSHCQDQIDYVDVTTHVKSFEATYEDEPSFVTIKNQIYTAVIKNEHSDSGYTHQLVLNSIDNSNNVQQQQLSCEIALPTPSSSIISSNKVVVLGNGKLVIATKKLFTPGENSIFFIVVDPFDCSTQKAIKLQYEFEYMDVLDLVPYHDTYDVFYKYYVYSDSDNLPKNPHRYDDQGQHIELEYSLETYPNLFTNFQINTIKPFDVSEGYYHTYYDNAINGVVIKRLNSRFETVKEVRFNYSVYVSTTHGHISYCSFDKEKSVCNFLNADLEIQVTKGLPKLKYPKHGRIEILRVINLPEQRIVVYVGFENPNDSNLCDFYIQPVSSDKSLVKTLKIGTGPLTSYHTVLRYYSNQIYYTYVPSVKDFCSVVITPISYKNIDVYNRCLDLSLI